MGGDGGSYVHRTELVKTKKKAVKEDPRDSNESRWRFCSHSAQILHHPVVADELGLLYNKEAVLQALLAVKEGHPMPTSMKHIHSLKDVHQLNLKSIHSESEGGKSIQLNCECKLELD